MSKKNYKEPKIQTTDVIAFLPIGLAVGALAGAAATGYGYGKTVKSVFGRAYNQEKIYGLKPVYGVN